MGLVSCALAVGIATHLAVVYLMPYGLMDVAMNALGHDGQRVNRWLHQRQRASADSRTIVRPATELANSICVLDLSGGDVRLVVHPSPGYWSLSLYAADSDNLRTWDDLTSPGGVDVTLTHRHPAARGNGVRLPSVRGIALVRRLAPTAQAFARAVAIGERDVCALQR